MAHKAKPARARRRRLGTSRFIRNLVAGAGTVMDLAGSTPPRHRIKVVKLERGIALRGVIVTRKGITEEATVKVIRLPSRSTIEALRSDWEKTGRDFHTVLAKHGVKTEDVQT